jgi:Na+/H+ antiporter NhaD/arsenite permease-like protein
MNLVGLLITILIAALVFWILAALTTTIVGVVGAILVLLAGIPSGGFGFGGRFGGGYGNRRAL